MLDECVKNLIAGKKVLIMGFGREGKSTYRVLKKVGGYSSLAIADLIKQEVPEKCFSGENYQRAAASYDIVFKSPGVVLSDKSMADKLTSQTDVVMKCMRDRMIGITGTKGKSTTTALIYHALKTNGFNAHLMGNIGIPAFEAAEELAGDALLVYELSCHQLEFAKYSPHIGVLLNIYPEHLDHYGSFEAYEAAKKNIYKKMGKDDFLFCAKEICPDGDFKKTTFSMTDKTADFYIGDDKGLSGSSLIGIHNMYNAAIAREVCAATGLDRDKFNTSLKTFKTLPHRLEMFAEINGVRYFDDSISTIPETTVQALESIENVGTLLLGGMDRHIDLSVICDYLIKNPVKRIILMPDTGKRIYKKLKGNISSELIEAATLKEAAKIAKAATAPGEACLLSPAAASYGFFENFEERGEKFKKYILQES